MVGMYDGKEFIVGTAFVKKADEPRGFEIIALDRKGYHVCLRFFIVLEDSGFPNVEARRMAQKQEIAQQWADRFNGK